MILRPSMAAAAKRGGREAEKQYPWPDNLCEGKKKSPVSKLPTMLNMYD